jgi:hypothetical protein
MGAIANSGGSDEPKHEPLGVRVRGANRNPQEQIVRFARPSILFYDEQVIALYHRICALYRMG